jgi:hypothetical protein
LLSHEFREAVQRARVDTAYEHGKTALSEDVIGFFFPAPADSRIATSAGWGVDGLPLTDPSSRASSLLDCRVREDDAAKAPPLGPRQPSWASCLAREGIRLRRGADARARLLKPSELQRGGAGAFESGCRGPLEAIEGILRAGRTDADLRAPDHPPPATRRLFAGALRQRFPQVRIWSVCGAPTVTCAKAAVRLKAAGADDIVTRCTARWHRVREHAPSDESRHALRRVTVTQCFMEENCATLNASSPHVAVGRRSGATSKRDFAQTGEG